MNLDDKTIHIVGAGLAGSECAYQLASLGFQVILYEMRHQQMTPAHKTNKFAELVCSNSFGSQTDYSAPGQLKWEAQKSDSLILKAAKKAAIPAGMALGVDRHIFAEEVTTTLHNHPHITVRNEVVSDLNQIPRPAVIATGPLTHEPLAQSLLKHFDEDFLYFYDAIAPIIDADTIDMDITYKADRFDKGTNDYINCPFTRDQYFKFIEDVKAAKKVEPKEFEKIPYFESCMPIEVMIERGDRTARFGPMSSNGIRHPFTGDRPYAVVQLRQENKEATAYNMVGFQTKMAYSDQKKIFRTIPGLAEAEFLKLGSIHRNLYIHSPKKLNKDLSSRKDPHLYFAGQITGVEGYFESTCIGLMVAHFIKQKQEGQVFTPPDRHTAFGALLNAITEDKKRFQPTNINFGLFPNIENLSCRKNKIIKKEMQIKKAQELWEPMK